MRTEERTKKIPIFQHTEDDLGEIVSVEAVGETLIREIDIFADKGKCLKDEHTCRRLGTHITIGTSDSIDNYEEVEL